MVLPPLAQAYGHKYLNSNKINYLEHSDDNFSLLQWWNDHNFTSLVLSTTLEFALSLVGKILEKRRSGLTSNITRTIMTMKVMELGKQRRIERIFVVFFYFLFLL